MMRSQALRTTSGLFLARAHFLHSALVHLRQRTSLAAGLPPVFWGHSQTQRMRSWKVEHSPMPSHIRRLVTPG